MHEPGSWWTVEQRGIPLLTGPPSPSDRPIYVHSIADTTQPISGAAQPICHVKRPQGDVAVKLQRWLYQSDPYAMVINCLQHGEDYILVPSRNWKKNVRTSASESNTSFRHNLRSFRYLFSYLGVQLEYSFNFHPLLFQLFRLFLLSPWWKWRDLTFTLAKQKISPQWCDPFYPTQCCSERCWMNEVQSCELWLALFSGQPWENNLVVFANLTVSWFYFTGLCLQDYAALSPKLPK